MNVKPPVFETDNLEEDLKGIKPELAFSSPSHVVGLEGKNLTLKCFFYG